MAKLSQKARKKLLANTATADVPQDNPVELLTEVNVWKKISADHEVDKLQSGLEVLSLTQIMNEEKKLCPRPQRSSFRESLTEENPTPPATSSGATRKWTSSLHSDGPKDVEEKPFEEIMADERKQREITKKIMEKPLDLTQIEDKAINELQLLYKKLYGFEERITVRRRSVAKASKPVWRNYKES